MRRDRPGFEGRGRHPRGSEREQPDIVTRREELGRAAERPRERGGLGVEQLGQRVAREDVPTLGAVAVMLPAPPAAARDRARGGDERGRIDHARGRLAPDFVEAQAARVLRREELTAHASLLGAAFLAALPGPAVDRTFAAIGRAAAAAAASDRRALATAAGGRARHVRVGEIAQRALHLALDNPLAVARRDHLPRRHLGRALHQHRVVAEARQQRVAPPQRRPRVGLPHKCGHWKKDRPPATRVPLVEGRHVELGAAPVDVARRGAAAAAPAAAVVGAARAIAGRRAQHLARRELAGSSTERPGQRFHASQSRGRKARQRGWWQLVCGLEVRRCGLLVAAASEPNRQRPASMHVARSPLNKAAGCVGRVLAQLSPPVEHAHLQAAFSHVQRLLEQRSVPAASQHGIDRGKLRGEVGGAREQRETEAHRR